VVFGSWRGPFTDPLSGRVNYQICLMCGCRRSDAVEAQNEVMETWDALRARRNVRKFTAAGA